MKKLVAFVVLLALSIIGSGVQAAEPAKAPTLSAACVKQVGAAMHKGVVVDEINPRKETVIPGCGTIVDEFTVGPVEYVGTAATVGLDGPHAESFCKNGQFQSQFKVGPVPAWTVRTTTRACWYDNSNIQSVEDPKAAITTVFPYGGRNDAHSYTVVTPYLEGNADTDNTIYVSAAGYDAYHETVLHRINVKVCGAMAGSRR